MKTSKRLEQATSIMTMSHDTVSQMARYGDVVKAMADKVDCGLITINEALTYIRNHG